MQKAAPTQPIELAAQPPRLDKIPPRDTPATRCPHCGGWLHTEFDGCMSWDLVCISCSRTTATWRPGMTAWATCPLPQPGRGRVRRFTNA